MSKFRKFLFFASFSHIFFFTPFDSLHAYVTVPRSVADTTERMNTGGDPPNRPGLIDEQRSPEFLDDWWGLNDYYYSQYGIHETGRIRNPAYDSYNPPYYPLPNIFYDNDPSIRYYDYNTRYYRPNYPR